MPSDRHFAAEAPGTLSHEVTPPGPPIRLTLQFHYMTIPDAPMILIRALPLILAALLLVQPASSQAVEAPSTEEVAFANGDLTLAATLTMPPGPGPHPAVLIVHGSGSSDRSNPWTTAYADALVDRGFAVLHPDKRGSGQSAGNWREASFLDLADDAVAALRLLGDHRQVDSTRIGIIGFSQGGQIAPVAMKRSSLASFVVSVSASVVPILEQIGDEIRLWGMREDLTANELEALDDLHGHATSYILTGASWNEYADALATLKAGRLGGSEIVEGFPTSVDDPAWAFLKSIGGFDPLPYWRDVKAPTLFIYGGQDENVDVRKSADIIQDHLTDLNYSLLIFRRNGHALFRMAALNFIESWIREQQAAP